MSVPAGSVLERPRADPPGAPVAGPEAPPVSTRELPPRWPVAAELALAGVTAASAFGFARVFSSYSFAVPVLVAVVFAHTVASAGRHLNLPPVLSGLISALSVLLITAWIVEPSTTTLGLPLQATWKAIGTDLHDAWQRFGEVKAPTDLTPGFLAAAVCGAALAGAVADGLAFRTRARFEALAPSFTLFVIGALLGADRSRVASAGIYLAAVLVFVVISAPSSRAGDAWFGGRARDGESALLRGGLAVAAGALALGLALGPHLPGARATGLVGLRDKKSSGSSSRVTVSPLVDIRNRLVDQSDTEMFTVASTVPSYWRLTSLGRFDGTIWSSVGSYQPASGGLAGQLPPVKGTQVSQQFAVASLQSIWLPAAYRATHLDGAKGIRFDADSSSLLTDSATSDGLTYTVQSTIPDPTPADLEAITPGAPTDIAAEYLELPSDFPSRVRQLASQVTGSSSTPYDKAKALQDWFRSSFTYDVNVPAGHDESAIERFLFVTRRGYCEQFAGTFAAMARSIGLPARVGVGFTAGTAQPDGSFHVAGKDAHAWPEVFLGRLGWIAFEPTPGRSIPNASYTGVAPSAAQTTPTTAAPATPTTAVPGSPTTVPPTAPPTTQPAPSQASAGAARHGGGVSRAVLLAAGLLALATAYAVGVPALRRSRRRQRRAAATTPTAQVLVAWDEATESLALTGVRRLPAETPAELAVRAGTTRAAVAELAARWSTATWSPAGAAVEDAVSATAAAAHVHAEVARQTGALRRFVRDLDPRPLWA